MKKLLLLATMPIVLTGCTTTPDQVEEPTNGVHIFNCDVEINSESHNPTDLFENVWYTLSIKSDGSTDDWYGLEFYKIIDGNKSGGESFENLLFERMNDAWGGGLTKELLLNLINKELVSKHWGNRITHCSYNKQHGEILF